MTKKATFLDREMLVVLVWTDTSVYFDVTRIVMMIVKEQHN